MNNGFFERVYTAVKSIPEGKVATYGDIACLINEPKKAKYVGFALHANTKQFEVPCYKVVDRKGSLAPSYVFGGIEVQKMLLEKDGVEVKGNKVDLSKYRVDIKKF